MTETGRIILLRTETGWNVRFTGDAAKEIRRLFGTDIIPAPFTANAPASDVRRQIQAGWPDYTVEVAQ